jgi:hypothetical protein
VEESAINTSLRYILYPAIPSRSKEGFQRIVTTPGAVMVAESRVGIEGGKVSFFVTWARFELEEMREVTLLVIEGEEYIPSAMKVRPNRESAM